MRMNLQRAKILEHVSSSFKPVSSSGAQTLARHCPKKKKTQKIPPTRQPQKATSRIPADAQSAPTVCSQFWWDQRLSRWREYEDSSAE